MCELFVIGELTMPIMIQDAKVQGIYIFLAAQVTNLRGWEPVSFHITRVLPFQAPGPSLTI